MINHIITEYEKQLSNLKEMKNKLVSENLFESQTEAKQSDDVSKSITEEIKDISISESHADKVISSESNVEANAEANDESKQMN